MEIGFAILAYMVYELFKVSRRGIDMNATAGNWDFFCCGLLKFCLLFLEAFALLAFIATGTSMGW